MSLDLDEELLAACVSCGLCLPHCPTYRVTGEESASPRGRIAAMREARVAGGPPPAQFAEFMDLCVGCRGCESACPSSVSFGELMDQARSELARSTRYVPRFRRVSLWALCHHRLLLLVSSAAALLQRARLLPDRAGLPRLPLRRRRLRIRGRGRGLRRHLPAGSPRGRLDGPGVVWLFTGCVMDAWMRDVHQACVDLVEFTGGSVLVPGGAAACCGALHLHTGLDGKARTLARRVVASMPGGAPVLVDSAGCAAALAGYGDLLGGEDARRFASRVTDACEWLAGRIELLPPPRSPARPRIAVQDPCHQRHVLGSHRYVRKLLAPYAEVLELDDEGLCCGAGGAYASAHQEMADRIRRLKVESIARSRADAVSSANPGCIAHLRGAGLEVSHPVQIVARAALPGSERR